MSHMNPMMYWLLLTVSYLSELESNAMMVTEAVMMTMALIIEALILFFTRRYPNNAEKIKEDDARREAVDAGRYAYAYAYIRLSAALRKPSTMYERVSFQSRGVGKVLQKMYVGNRIKAVRGHPATATHEMIHLLVPPFW
ncbi:hypothetical protein TorRG33x02_049420 [Trema orientale]|uniref:Uncharacterized protein n=1 Tax=Trema orientale TaxID=63057 RepID=A0A2P5FNN0_TREOI|nr:hypothetical protein TorRG33x02_049420 [Trema orientale]